MIRRIALTTAGLLLAAGFGAAAELPDFTELVEDNAAAVVNVSTTRRQDERDRRFDGRGIEEFFRRFPPQQPPTPRVRPRSLGSGFVISEDGYVLTNNHVVEDADEILVRFADRRELKAEVVGTDRRSDLALLKVEADNLPTVRMGRSEDLDVGEWVLAIGSPFGFDYSVTAGIVSAKGRSLPTEQNENYVPFIQTDVAINPGNSGGPLFNLDGEVVGINSQIYSRSGGFMGVSFAIPIDVAMEVVEQIKSSGRVSRGWLGVVIQEVSRELAESFGLERPHGALISEVAPGGPADQSELQAGDVIIEFDGQPIERSSELPHYVGRTAANSEVGVAVMRGGERLKLKVKVGELPDIEGEGSVGQGTPDEPSSLGLVLEDVPEAALSRFELKGGVRVVQSTGPAADSGIRAGDIITRLNHQTVENQQAFRAIAKTLPKGRRVPVLIVRGGVQTFVPLSVPE
ncbi:MAG: DegQ family serine endoprotease [Gammaproteobacteria bacterium]|nr:DegQ family serine endoprotease [Gammaproteobacteria bacterium]